jgi:hypothetical protein
MTTRPSVLQVAQWGAETTEGTSVAANRTLPSIPVGMAVAGEVNKYPALGFKAPTVAAPGREWTEVSIQDHAPTYDELTYLLASALVNPSPVQQGGTTAYLWTFTPSPSAADTIATYTVEQGSSFRAHKATGVFVSELTLKGDRQSVTCSGKAMGRLFSDGITMTGSPTAVAQIPILPKHVDVYIDSTSGALGTTKQTRPLSWELSVKRFAPLWVVDSANTSFAARIETEIELGLKLKMQADAQGMALLANFRSGALAYVRVVATSDAVAGTAYPYKLQWDGAFAVDGAPGEIADSDGVFALDWSLMGMSDSGWSSGRMLSVALTNRRTAL